MPSAVSSRLRGFWDGNRGLIVPALMAASILVIVAPLPAALLDLLLAANVTVAVVILLTTLYVRRPLEFSVFPSLLLVTTLSRLVLNVASTRLILTRGAQEGTAAAGGVIQAFGEFVAGGNVTVGLIIFSILVAIQFLVITKGATRISEVAARFALDGMPGKQMAIDADLQAGVIDSDTARSRRQEVAMQADFYGAMDGAGKFVRGDAIAGIVITLINIVGGIYLGLFEHGLSLREASLIFTKLTIGDGLVTQIPAFLISLAAGLLVTRNSVESDLPNDILGQLFVRPEALSVAAVFLGALSFTGLPRIPLLGLGAGLIVLSGYLARQQKAEQARQNEPAEADAPAQPAAAGAAAKTAGNPEESLLVDPMELELGYGLIRLVDANFGGDLLDRVNRVRQKIAQEMGIILPKVRIRDNIRLDQRQYQIKIQDIPIAGGAVFADGLLAVDTGAAAGKLPGVATTDPATGRPATWIESSQRERADELGYYVVEPAAVVARHLTEVVRRHCDELLSRQQVHSLLENLKQYSPKIVDELIPAVLKLHQVHQVLCNLLREGIPIRNLETILETLGEYADRTQDLGLLTEFVRHALSRTICQLYRDKDRILRSVTLDPTVEEALIAGSSFGEHGIEVRVNPSVGESIAAAIADQIVPLTDLGYPPVVLTSAKARPVLRRLTESALPQLAVLSLNEITRDTRVESAGQVRIEFDGVPQQESLVPI